jgi:predicted alpha-1,2-mannosidase
MGSNARIHESYIKIINTDELVGYLVSQGKIHFCARFSKPFQSFSTWETTIHPGERELKGKKVGAILDFQTDKDEIIYLKVGISAVNIDQARKNLNTEVPVWDFDATVERAQKEWGNVLNRIIIEGNEEYKKIFYTALYHSLLQPSTTTDVDGTYPGHDKQIHMADGYTHYDNYAFWDSYRTKYPLLSLIAPDKMKDIVQSIIDIYEQSSDHWFYGDEAHRPHQPGFSCSGPSGYIPFLNCRNEHMLTVVLDAYAKGIMDTDMEKAYKGMRKEILVQMPDKYEAIGYIPARPDQTCELSYDSWCVAQMAQLVKRKDDYAKFMKRADFYRNTWDNNLGFFRARAANGEWLDFPESPNINREKYMYEGTPWQWRWFVPHNVPDLIELIGGRDKFIVDLDYFFSNDLYQAGNQPDIHAPFLFNYAGAPWLTQKWVNTILTQPMTQLYGTHEFFEKPIHDRIYKNTPDGYLLEMDDDYGCMAAWYVLSSMGLFQVCPGQPIYQLSSPIFEKVTLNLNTIFYPGKQFIIEAKNLSSDNIYIQSATLNGNLYHKSWISHKDIVKGGHLIYQMAAEPNRKWGDQN